MKIYATIGTSGAVYDTGKTATVTFPGPEKSDITGTRGSRSSGEPSADASLTQVVLNGWYVITVNVLGVTKTFKINVNVT